MTSMEDRVRFLFGASIEAKIAVVDALSPTIARAGQRLVDCLLNGGKVLLCGGGGSAANCLHFSTAMINGFEMERPPLPVIALTRDLCALTVMSHDSHYDQVFARQIETLGHDGDILLVLSTSGSTNSILHAVGAAKSKEMDTIALNGRDGGILATHLGPEDIELRVQADSTMQIREIHLFILYCFCDLIEKALFGQMLG